MPVEYLVAIGAGVGGLLIGILITATLLRNAVTRKAKDKLKASFNPSHPGNSGNPYGWWASPWHYGLNQGPIILMIENYRSGLFWRLMRNCPYIVSGLRRAGFDGGWL